MSVQKIDHCISSAIMQHGRHKTERIKGCNMTWENLELCTGFAPLWIFLIAASWITCGDCHHNTTPASASHLWWQRWLFNVCKVQWECQ